MPITDTYKTLHELNGIFQDLTIAMLSIDAPGWENSAGSQWEDSQNSEWENATINPYESVRIAWPTYGAPAWKITQNIAFLRITEIDAQINRHRDVICSDLGASTIRMSSGYTRVFNVAWNIYGPDSYDWARTIIDNMFLQQYRNTLSLSKIYLVPNDPAPRRAPELFQGQWWERVDFFLTFNALTIKNATLSPIDSAYIHLRRVDDSDRIIRAEEITEERSTWEDSRGSEFEDSGSSSFEPRS